MNNLLEGLNAEQHQAVISKNQYMLVLAGAGTGKTQVLTKRISNLINLGVEPSSILAVTFTNKAAKEMKERIGKLIDKNINLDEIWIGTFHSICNKMLRKNPIASRLGTNFQIIDADDQKSLVKQVIEENKIFEAYTGSEKANKVKECIKLSVDYINKQKDLIKRPKNCKFTEKDYNFFGFDALKIYKEYEKKRQEIEVVDFGDLMLYTVEMFQNSKDTLEKYQLQFKHILVDEFQDTNYIQYEWLKMLIANGENYLFVVGDDDQSIYGWRGANISNILDFDKKFKQVETIRLEQNYRSTNTILNCANTIIANNQARKGKNLWSQKEIGTKIQVYFSNTIYSEAESIARMIKKGINQGVSPNEYAILYRTNAISRSLESKLNEFKIPYRIIGGLGFWSRMEIKDVMSYLAILLNPKNNIAIERTINVPSRGIGKKTFEKIKLHALQNQIGILESIRDLIEKREIKPATKAGLGLQNYLSIIENAHNLKETPHLAIESIIKESKLIEYYMTEGEEKGSERELNLLELINSSEHFTNEDIEISDLEAFINYASLQTNIDKKDTEEAVQMMTIHTAKGLEFPNVFLAGVEEGIFPSQRNTDRKSLEEERRLMYVAITRAKENLSISSAGNRFNQTSVPSRFIQELPPELIVLNDESQNSNSYQQNYGFLEKPQNQSISKKMHQKRNFENYKIGSTIQHKKFGRGTILSIKEENERLILKIDFDFIGIKNIIVSQN